jgi:hypothetical protein
MSRWSRICVELEIDSGNAALVDDPARELARLMRVAERQVKKIDELPDLFGHTSKTHVLKDVNGNTVGHVSITGYEAD